MIIAIVILAVLLLIGAFANQKEKNKAPKTSKKPSVDGEELAATSRMRVFFESLQIVGRTKSAATRASRFELAEKLLPEILIHAKSRWYIIRCNEVVRRYAEMHPKETVNLVAEDYLRYPDTFDSATAISQLRGE